MMLRLVVVLGMMAGCAALFDDSVGIQCSGDTCSCAGDTSSCSHECSSGASCSLSCEETQCEWDCNGASACTVGVSSLATATINCAGGPCNVDFHDTAHGTVTECVAPDCKVVCRGQAVVVTGPTVNCP
jgi:hypothetical protein